MTKPHSNPTPDPIEPASETSAPLAADELFVHGLLSYLSQDTTEARETRITRAINAIKADQPPITVFRIRPAALRRYGALAAMLALVATAVYLGLPVESSAHALVRSSVAASRAPGDRRYEIREIRGLQTKLPADPTMVVDTRTGGLTLIKGTAPDGHKIVAGRDSTGPWALKMDGSLTRDDTQRAWPRWTTVGEESLFIDSVDRLLEAVEKSYALVRKDPEALEGRGTKFLDHIRAIKKAGQGPGPSTIDLWIDPDSKLVERLEMRWPSRPGPLDLKGPFNPDGPGPRDRPMRPPPGEGFGPLPRPEGGPRPDGPRPEGGLRPEGPRPDGPREGPREGGGGPRPDGPRDGPREGGGGGGGPQRPSPPTLVTIDRVDPPKLADNWFTPEAHPTR